MQGKIQAIRTTFLQALKGVLHSKDVEALRVKFLGKKGELASLMVELKNCAAEERPALGKIVNDLKEELSSHCENTLQRLLSEERESKIAEEKIDISLPGRRRWQAHLHPITQLWQRAVDILVGMGFSVEEGPNIESDYYNFEALNFPKDHPAREMQDTFYLSSDFLLRTHTSNVQIRVMEKCKPPIRIVSAGKCFRNETISSRSHVQFHQIEGFYVNQGVSLADLISTLEEFWNKLFDRKVELRVRPSYFPFVEPGIEVDIRCTVCDGKGCRLCKATGWLEVVGAGMVHPEVLKAGGIDPESYSGYAWGMGMERLALLQYGINDIRLFTENDLRFLGQFPS